MSIRYTVPFLPVYSAMTIALLTIGIFCVLKLKFNTSFESAVICPAMKVSTSIELPDIMWYCTRRFFSVALIEDIVPAASWLKAPFVGTNIVYFPVALIELATPLVRNCVLNCDAPERPAMIDTTSLDERVRVTLGLTPVRGVLVAVVVAVCPIPNQPVEELSGRLAAIHHRPSAPITINATTPIQIPLFSFIVWRLFCNCLRLLAAPVLRRFRAMILS